MMIWIFVGVVVATTMFLMVMYQHNREQLRTQFLTVNALNTEDFPLKPKVVDTQDSLDAKLWTLARQLREKENLVTTTSTKIRDVEVKLASQSPRDDQLDRHHRKVLEELKMELQLTELECKNLQEQITVISERREQLTKEVTKQQQLFNTAMNNLVTDLRFIREDSADAGKTICAEIGSTDTTRDVKGRTGMLFGKEATLLPFNDLPSYGK